MKNYILLHTNTILNVILKIDKKNDEGIATPVFKKGTNSSKKNTQKI